MFLGVSPYDLLVNVRLTSETSAIGQFLCLGSALLCPFLGLSYAWYVFAMRDDP